MAGVARPLDRRRHLLEAYLTSMGRPLDLGPTNHEWNVRFDFPGLIVYYGATAAD